MLLHQLSEAFPAISVGAKTPQESLVSFASRLLEELKRLYEHPMQHIAFSWCCPLDFLLLFRPERRYSILTEKLDFNDWLYAAAVRLFRYFNFLSQVRSAEAFDAECANWQANCLFTHGTGALEFVNVVFSGATLTMPEVSRLLSTETKFEFMTLLSSIARGSTSLVYQVEYENQNCVLKVPIPGAEDRFIREIRFFKNICHPNLPRIFGASEEPLAYLVLEYCQTGREARSSLDLVGLQRGLRFLHQKMILHGDIRLSNLGVRQNGTSVLLDFSHSRQVDRSELCRQSFTETAQLKKLLTA